MDFIPLKLHFIMKVNKKYTQELHSQFGYFATWFPGTPMELGDIGTFKNHIFTKKANLSDLGIQFKQENDNTKSDMKHNSKGAVVLTIKASGSAKLPNSPLTNADADITVEFSKENAVLFKAKGTTTISIKNQIALGKEIEQRYNAGTWEKEWAVITELIKADSATVLISSSSEGKIELKANADVKTAQMDIADANLDLKPSFSKGLQTEIIAKQGLTPLFKVSKIKKAPFQPPKFKINSRHIDRDTTTTKTETSLEFGEVETY